MVPVIEIQSRVPSAIFHPNISIDANAKMNDKTPTAIMTKSINDIESNNNDNGNKNGLGATERLEFGCRTRFDDDDEKDDVDVKERGGGSPREKGLNDVNDNDNDNDEDADAKGKGKAKDKGKGKSRATEEELDQFMGHPNHSLAYADEEWELDDADLDYQLYLQQISDIGSSESTSSPIASSSKASSSTGSSSKKRHHDDHSFDFSNKKTHIDFSSLSSEEMRTELHEIEEELSNLQNFILNIEGNYEKKIAMLETLAAERKRLALLNIAAIDDDV